VFKAWRITSVSSVGDASALTHTSASALDLDDEGRSFAARPHGVTVHSS
jgi:hypothetical protein